MDRATYDQYLAKFNARDYEGVAGFYVPDFEIVFSGIVLHGREQMLSFYRFLHGYLNETIVVDRFVSDAYTLAIEARVRIEGTRDLTADALIKAGYPRLLPLQAGQVIEMAQFIHYHVHNGKFTKALCAVLEA